MIKGNNQSENQQQKELVDALLFGGVLQKEGRFKEAIVYYLKALSIREYLKSPRISVSVCYAKLGLLCQNEGQFEKAIDYYRKSIAYDEAAITYLNLGICYYGMSQPCESIVALERALVLDLPSELAEKAREILGDSYNQIAL